MGIKGVKVDVTDTDNGAKALFARLVAGNDVSLSVGIHADAGAKPYTPRPKKTDRTKKGATAGPPITLVELGEIHEFGLGVPQRSWLGDWFDEGQGTMKQQLHGVCVAVLKEKIESFDQGLEQLGNLYVAQIQKRIAQGIEPANSPITIAMKGSSVPLIDTGQFRGAITYKVTSKDGTAEGGGDEGGGAE